MDLFHKNSLLNFLPQSQEMKLKSLTEVKGILSILERILSLCKISIKHMVAKDYGAFDPLVGENSCQIRAYMLYMLFRDECKHSLINEAIGFEHYIYQIILSIHKFRDKIYYEEQNVNKNSFNDKTRLNLENFLLKNELSISISDNLYMIFVAYFLARYTITNAEGIHAGIDYARIIDELDISKTIARKIIHKYQVALSKLSCNFIKLISEDISELYPEYIAVFDLLLKRDDDNRFVIPCFFSMDVILRHMSIYSAKILIQKKDWLKGEEENIYYPVNQLNNASNIDNYLKDDSCMVFRGISNIEDKDTLKTKLKKAGIEKSLLASTARHPQYPGKKLEALKLNPFSQKWFANPSQYQSKGLFLIERKFLNMKKWALRFGCCLEKHDTFFASHIFCANLSSMMKLNYTKVS